MDRAAALQIFARVVESGSFTRAAHELGLRQPAVSKQIAALERRLGAQLLVRTSRGLRPTAAGNEFYESAVRILGALDDAESQVAQGQERPGGAVRVAVPPVLTGMAIVPRLTDFFDRFTGLSLDFVVSERFVDLIHEGVDLAVRVGELDSSGLVARRIGSLRYATVASPAYLARHGTPATPGDLATHRLLANRSLGAVGPWRFANSAPDVMTPGSGQFSCNNPAEMREAALAGLGIVQSARAVFDADLQTGALVELLADFTAEPLPIHTLYRGTPTPNRVRVLDVELGPGLRFPSLLRRDLHSVQDRAQRRDPGLGDRA